MKRRAQQLMDMMRITQEDLKDSADGVSGTLAIGMVASYEGALLPGLIADFNSQYPKVTFQLRQDSTREIMELAKAGLFCKSDDIFPLPYWAAEGLGIAILPRSSIHLASSEKLLYGEL